MKLIVALGIYLEYDIELITFHKNLAGLNKLKFMKKVMELLSLQSAPWVIKHWNSIPIKYVDKQNMTQYKNTILYTYGMQT